MDGRAHVGSNLFATNGRFSCVYHKFSSHIAIGKVATNVTLHRLAARYFPVKGVQMNGVVYADLKHSTPGVLGRLTAGTAGSTAIQWSHQCHDNLKERREVEVELA
jgi:hypothetical protein